MTARVLASGVGALVLLLFALTRMRWEERAGRGNVDSQAVQSAEPDSAVVLHASAPVPQSTQDASVVERTPPQDLPSPTLEPVAHPVDDPVGCIVHGTVLDAEGRPISRWGPYVSVTDAEGARVNTKADETGHYSLVGLAPGEWTLGAGAVGYRGRSSMLELTAEAPIVRRDLVLERATTLRVRVVTSGGELLRDVLRADSPDKVPFLLPVATIEPPGPTIAEAQGSTSEQVGVGSFWDSGPLWDGAGPEFVGVLELAVEPPVFVSLTFGAHVMATQRVERGTSEVSFVVEREDVLGMWCSLRVSFVDAERREPLKGELQIGNTLFMVRDGSWSDRLAPGRYTLVFRSLDRARIPLPVTLLPGQELDLGTVELAAGLTIEGRLVDGDGQPVAGRLLLGARDPLGVLRFEDMHYETDPDGVFKIFGLVPGHYVLRTTGDDELNAPSRPGPRTVWVSGLVPVSTLSGSVRGLDVRLVKGGVLVLENTAALGSGAGCRILDEQGELLRWGRFDPGFVPRFVLPPGECTLVIVGRGGEELARRAVPIVEGTTEVDLRETAAPSNSK